MDLGVENLVCTRGIMALWSEDVDFAVFCIDSIHKHLEMVYGDEKHHTTQSVSSLSRFPK